MNDLADDPPEIVAGVPNAVLDTNVLVAIYSWHDFTDAARSVLSSEPAATLEHHEIQFRAQRARAAFSLALFLDERSWITQSPLNEVGRILTGKVPPSGGDRAAEVNHVKLYIYFIKDLLLPSWQLGADPEADLAKKSNDVDRLCLDWAERQRVPLISWEGHGPQGLDPSKLIPREAAKRGIDLVTPEELVRRARFDHVAGMRRFFSAWEHHAPLYLAENPSAREPLEYAGHFYRRMAENDWTR